MKLTLTLITVLLSMLIFADVAAAQEKVPAAEQADKLRLQLLEIQEKEGQLRFRVEALEQALKPENIERATAGIGSTKPEELREYRRRQLTIEKESVLAQLDIVQTTRARIEVELAAAEVRAYHESAAPSPEPPKQAFAVRNIPSLPNLLTAFGSAILVMFGAVAFMAYLTRNRI